jgi:hypothetical protein
MFIADRPDLAKERRGGMDARHTSQFTSFPQFEVIVAGEFVAVLTSFT